MALELVAGAVFGAAVAELLKAVIDAKEKATNFQQVLARLELTLKSVVPRVNEISRLDRKLNIPEEDMKELVTVLQNGQALVQKCSKISTINVLKKRQYSTLLNDLDYSLLRYFQMILPLDQFRDGKEVLLMTRDLHMQLVGAKDEGESSKPKGSEIQPRQGSNKSGASKPLLKMGDIKFQLRLTSQAKKSMPLSMKIGPLKLSI